jgi:CHAD domain-containing protein
LQLSMDKKTIKNIVTHHYRELNKFINNVNKHFKSASIHELRVEYKKLRAFLRMISEEKDEDKKIKITGKLKRAYRIAGSIRDLQLQCQRILTLEEGGIKKPEAYLKRLEQDIKKLKRKFSVIPHKKTIKKSIKTVNIAVRKISNIDPAKFINKNCRAIIAIITSRNFTDPNMHIIRKRLKDIFYTIHEFEKADEKIKFNGAKITNNEMEYFDQLLEEMGNFQDKITSLLLLNGHRVQLLSIADRESLKEIKQIFTADKDVIKNDLVNKLKNELIPHLQMFNSRGCISF